jgi:hypothetical protein
MGIEVNPGGSARARKHGLKMLFWGTTMGVKEHAVFVFESNGDSESFFNFQRHWLDLGTECGARAIENPFLIRRRLRHEKNIIF